MRGMWRPFLLLFALSIPLPAGLSNVPALLLELRIFNGTVEVTSRTRVTVHRAGDRGQPLAQASGSGSQHGIELQVPEGIYDVQAIEERDGQVVNIQWANRLVVMPYPDEGGRHLEVLNFKSGFGALQVRAADGAPPDVTLHSGGVPEKVLGVPLKGPGYALFVVPAGVYDLTLRRGGKTTRHTGVEVPGDRTRLWVVPNQTMVQTRRPLSSLIATTITAITSRTWISPPRTSSANPSSHSTSRMTTIVHSMRTSRESSPSASPVEVGGLQAEYRR